MEDATLLAHRRRYYRRWARVSDHGRNPGKVSPGAFTGGDHPWAFRVSNGCALDTARCIKVAREDEPRRGVGRAPYAALPLAVLLAQSLYFVN
jgi:hypothetical protein